MSETKIFKKPLQFKENLYKNVVFNFKINFSSMI